jgi:nucleotide-binding universal stress UspA family protein
MSGFTDGAIVAGIDGSGSAVQAAVWAGAEAVRRGRPLRLVQVYALPQVKAPVAFGTHDQVRAGLAARAEAWLAEARNAVLAEYAGLDVTTAAREWSPVTALVQESQHADLLALGSRGLGGFTGLLVGSTAVAVAAHAHCPIVVVRGRTPNDAPPDTGPVLVGADGSADSDAAIAFACEEARLRGTGSSRCTPGATSSPTACSGRTRCRRTRRRSRRRNASSWPSRWWAGSASTRT